MLIAYLKVKRTREIRKSMTVDSNITYNKMKERKYKREQNGVMT